MPIKSSMRSKRSLLPPPFPDANEHECVLIYWHAHAQYTNIPTYNNMLCMHIYALGDFLVNIHCVCVSKMIFQLENKFQKYTQPLRGQEDYHLDLLPYSVTFFLH